jgi:hypothetical protein
MNRALVFFTIFIYPIDRGQRGRAMLKTDSGSRRAPIGQSRD